MTTPDKLIRMANQIARHFEVHGDEEAILKTSEHIVKFWDPRMRAVLSDHVKSGGAGLRPVALAGFRDTLGSQP